MTREEKIAELINIRDNFNYTLAPREVFDDAIEALLKEPKTRHWKKMVSVYDMIEGKYRMIPYTRKDEELGNPPFYVCDCGNNSKKPTNYCPDCGAKMIEPQESEE